MDEYGWGLILLSFGVGIWLAGMVGVWYMLLGEICFQLVSSGRRMLLSFAIDLCFFLALSIWLIWWLMALGFFLAAAGILWLIGLLRVEPDEKFEDFNR